MTATSDSTSFARLITALAVAVACALLAGLSAFPPSSTRLYAWPWAGFAAAGWLLPVIVALYRIFHDPPDARLGGLLDIGFAALALTAVVSALASPISGAVLPHLLPVLGACALPYALLPCVQPATLRSTLRIGGVLLGMILAVSLLLWLQGPAGTRNAQPFGHANITGSVAALAACAFSLGFVREFNRLWRVYFALGTLLAIITAVSSGSRGAVLALAAAGATAAAITLLRRGRIILFLVLGVLIATAVIASNSRLRELALHGQWSTASRGSNDQRLAMITGGLHLGAERPLLGWGAGSIPHVFPRVRGPLPGDADNFLQLHNTPAQLWATLGTAGLLAALLITAGLLARLRATPWTPERIALASGLVAAFTIHLFDHPFATPLFAVLAATLLAAWTSRSPERELRDRPPSSLAPLLPYVIPALGLALLIPALFATARDLAARRTFSQALDHAAANNPAGYANALRRASDLAPSDPYYPHLLAAQLATGHPFPDAQGTSPQTAATLLTRTLETNPDLEYAHYNLGWLLLASDPETAARHFREAARLAPQRGAVYLGLGLARIHMDDTESAIRALATEWLLNPAAAWSPAWQHPPLAALVPRIHALAIEVARDHLDGLDPWAELTTPLAETPASYRRIRTGYGVLMSHPEGLPPVDFNIQRRIVLPPDLRARIPNHGWLDGGTLIRFLDTPAP